MVSSLPPLSEGASAVALEKELATYQSKLQELLAHEGKYVLIHGDEVAGFWDTYEDALQVGYQRFQLAPFLVKRIQAVEQIQFFSRDISPCHS